MALKIPISFKKDEKDMYDFLLSQLSPSIYIKEYLKSQMKLKENKTPNEKQNSKFELDF